MICAEMAIHDKALRPVRRSSDPSATMPEGAQRRTQVTDLP